MLVRIGEAEQTFGTSSTTDDDVIFEVAKATQSEVETYCNRIFDGITYAEYHSGDGTNKLMLDDHPISTVALVNDDVTRTWDRVTDAKLSDIAIEADEGILILVRSQAMIIGDD